MRILKRYWFILPILIIVLAIILIMQFGLGFVVAKTVANRSTTPEIVASPVVVVITQPSATATSRPSKTPTVSPTSAPTFTPNPTRTPTARPTNTSQPDPLASPMATATSTQTSTPIPQPTPLGNGQTLTVPILMYHYLSIPPAEADTIRLDLSVRPEQFESHLAYLRQAGYETISLEQLAFALSGQGDLPPKPIILTFDDGYRDNYDHAFPILRKYGYRATFFLFTEPIDFLSEKYLSWDMVKEMHQAGMEFGSHSYSHPDMSDRGVDFLVFEILASKEAIEERIEESVRFFAYPAGQYDKLTIDVLASANFWGAVTTQWGSTHSYHDRFEMLRLRVRGSDTTADLAEKLSYVGD